MTAGALLLPLPARQPRPWWQQFLLDAFGLLATSTGVTGPGSAATSAQPAQPSPATPPPADLDALMREHAAAAYRVALSILRDRDLAEDVTQEAMLKAWLALPSYRGDAPLRNWVLRITHNAAISAVRARRATPMDPFELPETANPISTERDAHGQLLLEAFRDALGELDDLSRSIVVLREVEQLSYEEIAELLDVALPTVKTRLLRARRHLARVLEGWRP
jgi:RNA polymerase sigma-70 factor (ECF subfamily)